MTPEYWAKQEIGMAHGPQKYQELQPESYPMIDAIVRLAQPDWLLLDLGCNQGRHLKYLREKGLDVIGVDVKPFDDPAILCDTFEHFLPRQPKGMYELVFTMGMTIELVPYTFPICQELARVARKALVLCIQETGIPYPRDWTAEIEAEGMKRTQYEKLPDSNASLLVFER